MTKEETAKVIAILQVNYPDNFKGKSDSLVKATVDLWAKAFVDDDYKVVSAAIMAHIIADTSRFMPPIGVIKAKISEICTPDDMTEQEAWGLVAHAIRNGTYGYKEEFAKLPPAVQRAVGDPVQLRDWAMMDTDTVQSVVASNFQRSYRVAVQREKDWQKLPENVRQFISGVVRQSNLRLDQPEDPEQHKADMIRKLREYNG